MPENQKVKSSIHFVAIIIFLVGITDSLISFYLPIQMQNFLHNLPLFGFLFGISAFTGACSDFILGSLSNRVRYITFMVIGLLLSGVVMVLALIPFSILLIIWLMIMWGLYYEFVGIGIFNYVSRYHHTDEQSKFFGLISMYSDVAYVIGPLVAGALVIFGDKAVYGVGFVFLLVAFFFIPRIIQVHRTTEQPFLTYKTHSEHYNLKEQWGKYKKIWKYASIFFVAAFLYNVWQAFIWTLIPIQSIGNSAIVSGIITATFTLPLALLIGFGGKFADKHGRKLTFIAGLFIASLFTYIFGQQTGIVLKIITAGISSIGFAFAYPALIGETSKHGQEHEEILGDMAGVQRIFVNAGYITGPILGGIIANIFGIQRAFSILGIIMLVFFGAIVIAMMHLHVTDYVLKISLADFGKQ
jgi:MFS family permease